MFSFLFAVPNTKKGHPKLWQFLLDTLLIPAAKNNELIRWTGHEYEFEIVNLDEIAKLWGEKSDNPTMNYEKLHHLLYRSHCYKGMFIKSTGHTYPTFKFVRNVEDYVWTKSKDPKAEVSLLRTTIQSSKPGNNSEYSNTTVVTSL